MATVVYSPVNKETLGAFNLDVCRNMLARFLTEDFRSDTWIAVRSEPPHTWDTFLRFRNTVNEYYKETYDIEERMNRYNKMAKDTPDEQKIAADELNSLILRIDRISKYAIKYYNMFFMN